MPCETWVYRFIFFSSSLHPFVNDEKKRVENIPKKYKYIIKQNSRLKSLYVNEYWILCWLKPILGTCNNKKIWNQQIIVFYLLVFFSLLDIAAAAAIAVLLLLYLPLKKKVQQIYHLFANNFSILHTFYVPYPIHLLLRCHYFSLEFSTIHLLSRFILIFFGSLLFIHGVNKKRSKSFFSLSRSNWAQVRTIAKHTRLQGSQAQ